MKNVKILIVENELLIAKDLSKKLTVAGYEVTGIIRRGEDARGAVIQDDPDLVIMDIKLDGELDGIDAATAIKTHASVPVIYLTDLDNKEVVRRAMATNPAAYLLKPFNEKQIAICIEQALYNTSEGLQAKPADNKPPQQEQVVFNHAIFVRQSNSHFKKLLVSDINYIKADGAYCEIHLTNGDKFTYSISMNHIHDKIAQPLFVRVNRSYVVNLDKVTEVKGNLLFLGDTEILVGETYREDVMKRLPFLR